MASDFAFVKRVPQRTADAVSGFIRSITLEVIVPPLVLNVCLLYVAQRERFGEHGESLEISEVDHEEMDMVQIVESKGTYGCAYGTTDIDHVHGHLRCRWTFEVMANNNRNILIGICSTTESLNTWFARDIRVDSEEDFYVLGWGSTRSKHGKHSDATGLVAGSVVHMQCDTKAKTVEWEVRVMNRTPKTFTMSDIDFSKSYRMATAFWGTDETLKLKSFELW